MDTPQALAAFWSALMAQAQRDLPNANPDDLHDIVAALAQVEFA